MTKVSWYNASLFLPYSKYRYGQEIFKECGIVFYV